MHWLRWLSAPFMLALLAAPCQALTVAPGMEVLSSLGQPLHGRVALSDLGDLNVDDIKASLGTDGDFHQAGVSNQTYYPTDLRFAVVMHPGGDAYIDVTTTQAINEPVLDFVLHVSWPHNDRLNELTVLLDPPPRQ